MYVVTDEFPLTNPDYYRRKNLVLYSLLQLRRIQMDDDGTWMAHLMNHGEAANARQLRRNKRASRKRHIKDQEPRLPWPAGHVLRGVNTFTGPPGARILRNDDHWQWHTDGTLSGRWEIDDDCTAISLPSHGSLVECIGARHPADDRELDGLVDADGINSPLLTKYDEVGNDAVVALVRTLANSPVACNAVHSLSLDMQGITTSGFVEIAQLLADPTKFQSLASIDLDYNDFRSDPEVVAEALIRMLRTPGALPSLRGCSTSLYVASQALCNAVGDAVQPRPPPIASA